MFWFLLGGYLVCSSWGIYYFTKKIARGDYDKF